MYFAKRLIIAFFTLFAIDAAFLFLLFAALTYFARGSAFGIAMVGGGRTKLLLFLVLIVLPAWAGAHISGRLVKKPASGAKMAVL